MSDLRCELVRIDDVRHHPNADRLDIVKIKGFEAIVGRGSYSKGDAVVYIPEASVLPSDVISDLGLEGRLSGKDKNRVTAVRLRGVLSQGLIHPIGTGRMHNRDGLLDRIEIGSDFREHLGIEKYEPPIPTTMSGRLKFGLAQKFDVENIQYEPDLFSEGELVNVSEKLHGTYFQAGIFGVDTEFKSYSHNLNVVTSKGLAAKLLVFDTESKENDSNIYVRAFLDNEIPSKIRTCIGSLIRENLIQKLFLMGEIVGPKVQSMNYGLKDRTLYIFDTYIVGTHIRSRFLSRKELRWLCEECGFNMIPEVETEVEFSKDKLDEWRSAPSLVGGGLREGVVIRSIPERDPGLPRFNRACAKVINPEYLTSKKVGDGGPQ